MPGPKRAGGRATPRRETALGQGSRWGCPAGDARAPRTVPTAGAGAGRRLHSGCLGNAACPAQAAAHTSRRCRAAVRWHQGPSGALAAAQRNCQGAICGPRASPSPLPQCPGPARVTLQPSPDVHPAPPAEGTVEATRLSEQPRATGAAGGPPLPAPVTFGQFPSRPHLIPHVRMGHQQHLPPAGWGRGGDDVARARCLEHSRCPTGWLYPHCQPLGNTDEAAEATF